MTRRKAYALLVFCLLGLVASVASTWVHYKLLHDPSYSSFCSINETWNCETVYQSRYATVRGVPVALGGVVWFVAATLLAAGTVPRRTPPAVERGKKAKGRSLPAPKAPVGHTMAPLFLWSILGLATVFYFAYTSFFVLKTYCILCLTIYVAVVGVFLLAATATDVTTMRSLPGRALGDLRALLARPLPLALVLLFVGGAASAVAFFPRQPEARAGAPAAAPAPLAQAEQSEFDRWYVQQPRLPIPVADDGAKVVVIKFNDYMCPPCKQTFMEYKPVLAKWQASNPGMVKFMTRDYPLDPECNVNAPGGQHLASCEAAVAVRLAREHGRAEAMEDWLFENQAMLTPAMVRQGAKDVGKVPNFDERYAPTLELVKGDIALGAQLGVKGTPTFFVNGVRIPGLKAEFFDAAIRYELKQAGVLK